ncbi:MAG TPA: FAD-dependent oxidoreductase [Clostridiaceae bacterium]|nr:FAD-dependent oxidoreductase [Clostridiaceae bacterium]
MNSNQNLAQYVEQYADWFLDAQLLQKNQYSNNLYPYDHLFSPIKLNQTNVKNRIMFNSLPNFNMAEQSGRPTEALSAFYAERAKGGVGLIATGAVPVTGKLDPTVIDSCGRSVFPQIIDTISVLSGWTELTETCHVFSAKIFLTLSAGPGLTGTLRVDSDKVKQFFLFAKRPISPSGGKSYTQNLNTRRLSEYKLRQIIANFAQAAELAKEVNFDGILIEGGRGELIAQMSDPVINRRKLGSFSHNQTFALEIIRRIRRITGSDYPIIYSLDLDPGNLPLDFLKNLIQAGVDGFVIRPGNYVYKWLSQGARTLPPGYSLNLADQIKHYFLTENLLGSNGEPVPIIASGKLDFPDLAEEALISGQADMICLEDALLADPEWAKKVYCNSIDLIRPVVRAESDYQQKISCSVNPRIGQEHKYKDKVIQVGSPRKIAIVGAGLAGIECAIAAHSKGHEIWLFEQTGKIGGKLNKTLTPSFRIDIANYLSWQQKRVANLVENSSSFNLVLNTIATMSMLDERNFDVIVVASGGKSKPFEQTDIEMIDVLDLDFSSMTDKTEGTLLEQLNIVEKNKIVIYGEHPMALDIAYNLVYAYDKQVSLLFEGEEQITLLQNLESQHLLYFLKRKKVDIYYNVILSQLDKEQISFQSTAGRYALPYDFLFKATGLEADPELYNLLYKYKISPSVYHIGDCAKPGSHADNIKAGYRLGINL